MPNLANAKKALRQSKKHAAKNLIVRAEIHRLRVSFRKAVDAKKKDEAVKFASDMGKKLDKAQQKNIMKKNAVARLKSRAMKKLNAIAK